MLEEEVAEQHRVQALPDLSVRVAQPIQGLASQLLSPHDRQVAGLKQQRLRVDVGARAVRLNETALIGAVRTGSAWVRTAYAANLFDDAYGGAPHRKRRPIGLKRRGQVARYRE